MENPYSFRMQCQGVFQRKLVGVFGKRIPNIGIPLEQLRLVRSEIREKSGYRSVETTAANWKIGKR